MSRALVLVWLGTAAARAEHTSDLDAWAASRVVTIAEPTPAPPRTAGYDPHAVAVIERLLDEGRTAVDAGDPETARLSLERAERSILAHPELPQAAWLMGEAWHTEAERRLASDPDSADEFERRATDLTGARARIYSPETADGRRESADEPAPATVALKGPRPTDDVYVDGVRIGEARVIPEGTHHIRVVRAGRPVFAEWVQARAAAGALQLRVAQPPPCTADDLGAATLSGDHLQPTPDVACPRWAAARPTPGGIEVALCFEDHCGTWLEWKRGWGAVLAGPPQPPPTSSGLPAWLGWSLAGAAVLAGGSFVAWQAGAFESPGRSPTTVIFNGPDD